MRGMDSSRRAEEVDKVPVRAAADIRCIFQYGQIVFEVLLLVFDAEVKARGCSRYNLVEPAPYSLTIIGWWDGFGVVVPGTSQSP